MMPNGCFTSPLDILMELESVNEKKTYLKQSIQTHKRESKLPRHLDIEREQHRERVTEDVPLTQQS